MRGLINSSRFEEIKKEVAFMYEETGINTLPVNPFEIAERLFYVIIAYSSLSPAMREAAMKKSNDAYSTIEYNWNTGMNQYVIYYNDSIENKCRIRWTLLHEIGHIYLGHHDNPDESLSAIEEAEANFFAKYAIAPPPLVRELGCSNCYEVADAFGTSYTAAIWSYDYFLKRSYYGPIEYAPYEKSLLNQFGIHKPLNQRPTISCAC